MGLSSAPDIRFDFDGSLALARQLWSYADELDQLRAGRLASAEAPAAQAARLRERRALDRVVRPAPQPGTLAARGAGDPRRAARPEEGGLPPLLIPIGAMSPDDQVEMRAHLARYGIDVPDGQDDAAWS